MTVTRYVNGNAVNREQLSAVKVGAELSKTIERGVKGVRGRMKPAHADVHATSRSDNSGS